jgi:hypothetical protein
MVLSPGTLHLQCRVVWCRGLLEGLPQANSYTCNGSATQYGSDAALGLRHPAPAVPKATCCAKINLMPGQSFKLKAFNGGSSPTLLCGAKQGKPLQCGGGEPELQLRAYPRKAWLKGEALPDRRLTLAEPLVLATGLREAAGAAFLTYRSSTGTLRLTSDTAVAPANVQLVRSTRVPLTDVPGRGRERGPVLLRIGGLDKGRYCSVTGVGGKVLCPSPSSKRGVGVGLGNPRDVEPIDSLFGGNPLEMEDGVVEYDFFQLMV